MLKDTVFLFPKKNYLDEVVVWGKHIVNGRELLKKLPKRDILEKAPQHSVGDFDLGLMLDKRLRRDKEHVRKQREVFKKFDGINVGDPILRAYHETMAEQKRKKIEKEIEEKHKNADGKVEKWAHHSVDFFLTTLGVSAYSFEDVVKKGYRSWIRSFSHVHCSPFGRLSAKKEL